MADILIRGMEEPPRCSACRMLEGDTDDGFCHTANKWLDDEWFCWYQYPEGDIATDKPLNCPLVPLPEGHGRLIDADALDKFLAEREKEAEAEEFYLAEAWYNTFRQILIGRPTIVPAEGGGE